MAIRSAQAEIDPALPPREGRAPAPATDLRREYAASGVRTWIVDPQILGRHDDEILAELGRDAYERSRNDPVIESAVEDLVMSATADEPILREVHSKGTDRYDEAVEARDFCRALWEGIANDPQDALEQVARAAAYNGHAVAEQTFENARARFAGRYALKYWKALPNDATNFVVDRYMNVLGLLAPTSGRSVFVGGTLFANAEVVAREKFSILTLRGRGSDPRGRSLVASAMTAREIKRQVIADWVTFLHRKAEPVPVGIAGENAPEEPPIDQEGNALEDQPPVTAAEAIAQKLALIDKHKSIGLAHGSEVTTLDLTGDSDLYLRALEWLDRQETIGILLQVLATAEAKFGTRAQAGVHENVKDLLIFWFKQKLARVLRRDLFRVAMLVNFGEEAARELTPHVTLGDYDRKDWAETATAANALIETLEQHRFRKATDEVVASIGLSAERGEDGDLPALAPPGAGLEAGAVGAGA